MPSTSWPYRAAIRVGAALAPLIGAVDPKAGQGDRRRRGTVDRLAAWAAAHRERERPLVWFHASSVGEGRQAESVLLELRRLAPGCQTVYTHFSPSAEPLARRLEVDLADYLPYDRAPEIDRLLRALAPDLLVFAKLDLWPELATRAAARGVTVALVAATVSPGSGRLRWPVRPLLRPGYAAVHAAAAVSEADARRLVRLGVAPERIRVLGDPRYDSVAARVAAVAPDAPLLRLSNGAPTLVAGSTWAADEDVVLAAFARVRARHPEARLIVVPHEPTIEHLAALDRRAAAAGLPPAPRLDDHTGAAPWVVVDRVGVLAEVYGAGTMAYVGGGLGRAGLHSVLEPAAWGIPVAFGPRWSESRDATVLLEHGGAAALAGSGGAGTASLVGLWEAWLADASGRQAQGARARGVVTAGLGAARRSAELLAKLISSRRLRT
jgi:3-deoxy-D-manno-octulosonic-acid transferase